MHRGDIVNPISLYAAIAVIAAAVGGYSAWSAQGWRYDAKDAQRIEAQAEQARMDRQAAQTQSEGFENDRTKTAIKYRTITRQVEKIIDRPIYSQPCFDDGGLHALRSAIGSASDTSEPADALPESR